MKRRKDLKFNTTSGNKRKYKDTALNHSKMVRKIEKKLKIMMIDYNTGVIIRMELQDKIALKEKLDQIWKFRQ